MEQTIEECITGCKKLAATAFTEAILEEEGERGGLLSREQRTEKMHAEWESVIGDFFTKIEQGARCVFEKLPDVKKNKPELFTEEVQNDLIGLVDYAEHLDTNAEAFTRSFLGGDPLGTILGLKEETKECFYQAARMLYSEKNYPFAVAAFSLMILLDPTNYNCWQALGNCEYFLENFDAALYAYAFAAYTEPTQPLCHVLSAQCYESIKEYDNAINACDIALYVIAEQEEWQYLKKPLEEMKQQLQNKK